MPTEREEDTPRTRAREEVTRARRTLAVLRARIEKEAETRGSVSMRDREMQDALEALCGAVDELTTFAEEMTRHG